MKYLILLNNAPKYVYFLKDLGEELEKYGHSVIFAIEHKVAEEKENVFIKSKKYYFNKYINNNDISYKYKNVNLNRTFYSCFQRHEAFKYNKNLKNDKNQVEIIKNLVCFFDELISRENIDFVIYENVSNSFAHTAYEVCKMRGIKYLGLITSRIPSRFEVWFDEFGNIDERKKSFDKLDIKDISEEGLYEITNYIKNINEIKPDYMKNNPTSMEIKYLKYYFKKLEYLPRIIKLSLNWKGYESYQNANPIRHSISMIKRNVYRKIRLLRLKSMYDLISENDKYFIYPMHFQPESSTSINAMYYDNQYELIKNIAFSLPLGYQLYVKDHPNGIGFFNMDFYKKIKKLPNVKYIDPLTNNKELINKSFGIITLTSTMGYEALLLNKPVITLGKVFYNYHPYCLNINSYNSIFESLNKLINMDFSKFNEYNIRFLKVYFDSIYTGKVFNHYSKNDLVNVANLLISIERGKN